MTRDKKVEIRFTNVELEYIENICASNGMTKSEFIRKAIRGGNANTKGMAKNVYVIQKIVNKMEQIGVTEEDLNMLSKEVDALWLYLR